MDESVNYKELKFFKEFDADTVKELLKLGSIKEFPVKEYIINEDQELRNLDVLLEGSVLVGITVPNKGKLFVGTIYPGHIFSWSAMFSPYVSTAFVRANTPVKVISLNAKDLNNLIERDPLFGYRLMRFISETLSRRLHDTRFQLVNIATI